MQESEIEVSDESVKINRPQLLLLREQMLGALRQALDDVADEITRAKSPWDGEDVDGEVVFFAVNTALAEALRRAKEKLKI